MMIKQLKFLFLYFCTVALANADVTYSFAPANGSVYIGADSSISTISYDASTNQFTGLFEGGDFKHFVDDADRESGDLTPDYTGKMALSAVINEAGELEGGVVSWVGGGSGIDDGTTLLEGNLTGFLLLRADEPTFPGLGINPFHSVLDFIIDVTHANAALNFSEKLFLRLYFTTPEGNPFDSSFSITPYSGQDLISITATEIPEPISIALVAIGLVGLVRRRRNQVSVVS